MKQLLCAIFLVSAALVAASPARASETDQFMTWNVELSDSTQLLNDYLNRAAQEFVDRRNSSNAKVHTVEEMGTGFYLYLFQGLHSSRIRSYIWDTPAIERFPTGDTSFWTFQRESIYRGLSFPYVMPMARTIRVGDVYCGIDKICHFFGFGRRYYQRYLRLRAQGLDEEAAIARVIENGVSQESSLVGGLVDGIFSRGDLEANFQGFMMLRDLTSKEHPFFVNDHGTWKIDGSIDYGKYVTPSFDESYNISYYTFFRWRKVAPILQAKYCTQPGFDEKMAQRFAKYANYPKSLFIQYLERQYESTHEPKLQPLTFADLCERTKKTTYACKR